MAVRLLRETQPAWFEAETSSLLRLTGAARLVLPGAAQDYVLQLDMQQHGNEVSVRETTQAQRLPRNCPERHINGDGTFCLGYQATTLANSPDGARVWWGLLWSYMGYQRTAGRTGSWPAGAFISHGDAGRHQILAAEAAAELGIAEQYGLLLEGVPCWIGDRSIKLSKDGGRLLNGRAACPVGCCNNQGYRLLRRQCCNGATVLLLMTAERRRKAEEARFWENKRAQGAVCCQTMRSCPLKDVND